MRRATPLIRQRRKWRGDCERRRHGPAARRPPRPAPPVPPQLHVASQLQLTHLVTLKSASFFDNRHDPGIPRTEGEAHEEWPRLVHVRPVSFSSQTKFHFCRNYLYPKTTQEKRWVHFICVQVCTELPRLEFLKYLELSSAFFVQVNPTDKCTRPVIYVTVVHPVR